MHTLGDKKPELKTASWEKGGWKPRRARQAAAGEAGRVRRARAAQGPCPAKGTLCLVPAAPRGIYPLPPHCEAQRRSHNESHSLGGWGWEVGGGDRHRRSQGSNSWTFHILSVIWNILVPMPEAFFFFFFLFYFFLLKIPFLRLWKYIQRGKKREREREK